MIFGTWPLLWSVIGLLVASAAILFAGFRITRIADELADRTGIGEAIAGAVFLGAVTSLSGFVTLAVGAFQGDAGFALANPLGGILLQTVWLPIADLVYRRVNLEHAAASLENIMQAVLLLALLSIPVIGYATPDAAIWGVHPGTFAILPLYLAGLALVRRMKDTPNWTATQTSETREDEPQPATDRSMTSLWVGFSVFAVMLAVSGYVTGEAGLGIVEATGLSGSLVGSTFTTAASSLSELVTLLAAVRIGALTLGVGDIVGGNLFDMLQVGVADVFYRDGSVYADAGPAGLVLVAGCIVISAVMAAGLLLRQKRGIGFEGIAIPAIWVGTIAVVAVV